MLEFSLDPLVGIGPIKFGQTRCEVRAVLANLGQPEASTRGLNTDCFFGSSFHVTYNQEGQVKFIELFRSSAFRVCFHEFPPLEIPMEDAVRMISEFAEEDWSHPEPDYLYIFPSLELSLWRGVLPHDPEDLEGRYAETVAVGEVGYTDQLRQIWKEDET
jgi:hypothetical protein